MDATRAHLCGPVPPATWAVRAPPGLPPVTAGGPVAVPPACRQVPRRCTNYPAQHATDLQSQVSREFPHFPAAPQERSSAFHRTGSAVPEFTSFPAPPEEGSKAVHRTAFAVPEVSSEFLQFPAPPQEGRSTFGRTDHAVAPEAEEEVAALSTNQRQGRNRFPCLLGRLEQGGGAGPEAALQDPSPELDCKPVLEIPIPHGLVSMSTPLPSSPFDPTLPLKVSLPAPSTWEQNSPSAWSQLDGPAFHFMQDRDSTTCGDSSPGLKSNASREPANSAGESSPGSTICQKDRRCTCRFVFGGFDLDRDADFELVPRLIGRGGVNMRNIAQACDGKVRIRGRGSGHCEGRPREEADVPLQIVLSCKDRRSFEEGHKRLMVLLDYISMHFKRYCKRKGLTPVPVLYSVMATE